MRASSLPLLDRRRAPRGARGRDAPRLAEGARGDVSVPPRLQAQLIGKVAAYDRNVPERAGSRALVLVVRRGGNAESGRIAAALANAVVELDDVGGIAKTVESEVYAGASPLAETCKARRVSIVYLSLGLEPEIPRIADSLANVSVMSVGATGAFAEAGANLGFDLDGSRPQLVVNLRTARAQGLALRAALLRLARVIDH